MRITKYVFLILLLIMLVACSQNEPEPTDIYIPTDDVEQDVDDIPAMTTLEEATSSPSPSNIQYEDTSKLLWFNVNGDILHEQDVSDADLLEAVHTENNLNSLLIHNRYHPLQLLNLDTREVAEVTTPMIPDSAESFVNSFGYGEPPLMFAGWVDDPIEVVISGNKSVYTYNTSGEPDIIFEASKPIYGSALSPNKKLLSLLIASDDSIGPEADLIVLDLQGQVVYEMQRISYIGHSDGWIFFYPMEWVNEHTVAVPIIGNKRAYALVNINDSTVPLKSEPTLTEESFMLLRSKFDSLYTSFDSLETREIIKVLTVKSTDEKARYFAINTSTKKIQVWLMDVLEETVTLLSEGQLIGSNEYNELIILQSSSFPPQYAKLNLN